MRNCTYMVLVGMLTMTLAACESAQDRAVNHAQSLIAQHDSLATEITAQGVPNPSWTNAQLDSYESELNEFSSVVSEMNASDGDQGVNFVTTGGGDDATFISDRREALAEAREAKDGGPSRVGVLVTSPPTTDYDYRD